MHIIRICLTLLNILNWYNIVIACKRHQVFAQTNNAALTSDICRVFFNLLKCVNITFTRIRSLLDFNRVQFPVGINKNVNFVPVYVTVEVQVITRIKTCIVKTLQNFAYNTLNPNITSDPTHCRPMSLFSTVKYTLI